MRTLYSTGVPVSGPPPLRLSGCVCTYMPPRAFAMFGPPSTMAVPLFSNGLTVHSVPLGSRKRLLKISPSATTWPSRST